MLVLNGSFQYMTMGDDIPAKDFNWFPTSLIGVSLQIPITSWASTTYKIKQIKNNIRQKHLQTDTDMQKLINILNIATEKQSGLIAYCD
jgi:hypothetical protein